MATSYLNNPRQLTILAALCYVILLVAGPIGLMYMPEQIVVAGDATQTAQNMRTNSGTFYLGVVAQVVIIFTEIVLTGLLYVLMKPAGHATTLMASFARLAMTVVMAINLLPLLMMAEAASGANYLASFSADQLDSLVLLFFQTHNFGTVAWQLFFALHMLLLGILVFNSTYLPRFIGLALIIGSPSYAFDSFGRIFGLMELAPYSLTTNILLGVSAVGELGLAIWFLFKGVDLEKWRSKLAD